MNIEYRLINFEKDKFQLSKIYCDSWKKTYIGLLPEELLNSFNYEKSLTKWTNFKNNEKTSFIYVAVDKGCDESTDKIIGLAASKVDDDVENTGFLYSIHISSDYKGKGIGKNLIKLTAKHFKEHFNLSSLLLWVVIGNDNAYNVYTKLGATELKKEIKNYVQESVPYPTPEVCLIWKDTTKLIQ